MQDGRGQSLNVDARTPAGEMMANVMATCAQFERRLIGQRTRDALAQRKADGVRLGQPRQVSREPEERVRELRANGISCAAVNTKLFAEGHRPTRGTKWWPNTLCAR